MPTAAKRPCTKHPHILLGRGDRCKECRKVEDSGRQSAHKRGYNAAWQRARKAYLMHHPLCVECEKQDRISIATVVDHITPHKGDKALFWDSNNWQALCKRCHDIKTATHDGGFGRQ